MFKFDRNQFESGVNAAINQREAERAQRLYKAQQEFIHAMDEKELDDLAMSIIEKAEETYVARKNPPFTVRVHCKVSLFSGGGNKRCENHVLAGLRERGLPVWNVQFLYSHDADSVAYGNEVEVFFDWEGQRVKK